MTHMKFLPTKDLFQALLRAKRDFARTSESVEPSSPTSRSPSDAPPPSLGDELDEPRD